MIQSVIESIIIAAAIIALVATGYIYSPNPLGQEITHQLQTIRGWSAGKRRVAPEQTVSRVLFSIRGWSGGH